MKAEHIERSWTATGGDPRVNISRRRFLLGATSAVGGLGIVAAAIPFVGSWQPSAKARALGGPVRLGLDQLLPGRLNIVEWRGRPVFVLKRSPQMLGGLDRTVPSLADPDSTGPQQPEYGRNAHRSLRQEISVLVGLCTHLGCSPAFVPEAEPQAFDSQWQGGYFCPCHGSKFDLAGRVYSGVPAPANMIVPPHRYEQNALVVGEDPTT